MGIEKGNKIKVDYEGRFENGEIFDSSHKHEGHLHLLEFEVGSGQVIPGFDNEVIGLEIGDEKEFILKPEDAYGPVREELVKEIPKKNLPKGQEPRPGMMLMIKTQEGQQFPGRIIDLTENSVIIDLNHPLAGKTLIFKIKIVEIGK